MPVHPCSRQNDARSLLLLKAASNRYGLAKRLLAVRATSALAAPFVLLLTNFVNPAWEYWGASYGLIVVFFDQMVVQTYSGLKRQGAKVQELFDCRVLGLQWNQTEFGAPPLDECIVEWADRFGARSNSRLLEDWYPPELAELPTEYARIACQRVGTQWDFSLRARYVKLLLVVLFAGIVSLGGISLTKDWSVRTFVIVTATLLPAMRWGTTEYRQQKRASEARKRLRSRLEECWNRALAGEGTQGMARRIQDALFVRRAKDPEVFNWWYRLFRETDEKRMREVARTLVKQWKSKVREMGLNQEDDAYGLEP